MADPTFLKHLDYLRRTYKPHHLNVNTGTLLALQFDFKEIGRFTQCYDAHHYHQAVKNLLWEICARSLDMMKAKDYNKVFEDARILHENKNAGYAGLDAVDPWANFRMAEWFDVSPFVGCMIRMTDKFIRIGNLHKHPEADKVHESIEDAMYDLAIYALIGICLWDEEYEVVQCDTGVLG
jgi:hypothetical protein